MASNRPASPSKGAPDSPEVLALLAEAMRLVPFVVKQARLHLAAFAPEEDVVAYANEGALHAARSFDPSRRVPFSRWASLRMRGAIIDGLRRAGDLPRRTYQRLREIEASLAVEETMTEEDASAPGLPTAAAADARLGDYLAAMATSLAAGVLFTTNPDEIEEIRDPDATPDERLESERVRAAVQAAMGTLREKERTLVERYWIDGMTLEAAGASMGLSKSWASRLHTRAIVHITKVLQGRGVEA